MLEISWTDLDIKYVHKYKISSIAQGFKVYFYQYDICKLHGCYTLKKENTSVTSITKVLLINSKDRNILPINKHNNRKAGRFLRNSYYWRAKHKFWNLEYLKWHFLRFRGRFYRILKIIRRHINYKTHNLHKSWIFQFGQEKLRLGSAQLGGFSTGMLQFSVPRTNTEEDLGTRISFQTQSPTLARKCWLWVRDCFQSPDRDFDTSSHLYYTEGKQEPSLLMMKRAQSTGAKTENRASQLNHAKGLLG